MVQMTTRIGVGTNKPARMAACGIRHASMLLPLLPSQSREDWIVALATAYAVQHEGPPGTPEGALCIGGQGTEP